MRWNFRYYKKIRELSDTLPINKIRIKHKGSSQNKVYSCWLLFPKTDRLTLLVFSFTYFPKSFPPRETQKFSQSNSRFGNFFFKTNLEKKKKKSSIEFLRPCEARLLEPLWSFSNQYLSLFVLTFSNMTSSVKIL